jgi:hypothetical protein
LTAVRLAADESALLREGSFVKNKHLKLSIAIALAALSLSLLFISGSGKRTESSSMQTAPTSTPRMETPERGRVR